jgi:hypothetical protein
MDKLQRIQDAFVGAFIGFLISFIITLWTHKPAPAVPGETPKQFAGPKEIVPCDKIQALPSKKKKELGLPPAVVKEETERLIAVAAVPMSDGPQLAGALINTKTGLGSIYFEPQPRPWVAFNRRWAVGYAYTYGDGDTESKIYGRWELLQVKRIHVGAVAELYRDGKTTVGAFGEYQ